MAQIKIVQTGESAGLVGADAGAGEFVFASFPYNAASVDATFFVATRSMAVKAITCKPTVAGTDGGAVTAVIRKVPDATAIAAGTALHSSTYNLKGTAVTNQALTVSTTASDLVLAAGYALAVDFTGTMTSATGVVTVAMCPV